MEVLKEKPIYYENYKLLACSIIKEVADDFIHGYYSEITKQHFIEWCNNCKYFDYLDLDRDYFIEKCINRKDYINGKSKKTNY